MSRDLYLHETVDIVGDEAVAYMEQSVLGFEPAIADRGLRLFGTWQVMGSTGRWPQVVNVWEMQDGFDGWERLCRATNLRRQANPELASWWREAYRRRSGGFDRLLGAARGSPSLAELREAGVHGTLFVHELSRVRPGSGADYLGAVREQWAPVLADHGHRLVGLWEALLNDTEVCTLWATDLSSHLAFMRAADAGRGFASAETAPDDRIVAWRARARDFCTRWREELLIPCPGTPLGPDSWAA